MDSNNLENFKSLFMTDLLIKRKNVHPQGFGSSGYFSEENNQERSSAFSTEIKQYRLE